ncbi:hypothetical protein AXF42_Ash007357 [Apostasia shenzhenica]|uniref:Uncharacterized protein n=1 Tax=Apostasia shenzhenica TaxID=1088818 RepID=A0A2I0BA22_9ASPA|nr:hypothetical protein AXF42_Ash007357 [Apostasia shenzhenica]
MAPRRNDCLALLRSVVLIIFLLTPTALDARKLLGGGEGLVAAGGPQKGGSLISGSSKGFVAGDGEGAAALTAGRISGRVMESVPSPGVGN